MSIVSPFENFRMWSWQVAVPVSGPWARPLIIMPQVPQMPSRQSWGNSIGTSPCLDQLLVDNVEHLEEGGVGRDVVGRVGHELAGTVRAVLTPDVQGEVERVAHL